MGKKHHVAPKPNVVLDTFLTSLFFIEIGVLVYNLSEDMEMFQVLLIGLVGVAMAINFTKWSFRVGGKWFSNRFLQHVGNPLKKKTTLKKYYDQGWQLMIHVSMVIYEISILQEESWWDNTKSMWELTGTHCAVKQRYMVKVFYIVQLAIWIYTAFSCKYLEEIRKDYFVMMSHHVVTIALVMGSYISGYLPIGVTVLFLHDLSDIPLDILKMTNYMKLEGLRGLFIVEMAFVLLMVEWFYLRVYLFPSKLIYSSIVEAREQCPSSNDPTYFPEAIPYWLVLCCLLVVLWLLHIWWSFLILRLLVGIITQGSSHQAGEDEYEGASSESDSDFRKED